MDWHRILYRDYILGPTRALLQAFWLTHVEWPLHKAPLGPYEERTRCLKVFPRGSKFRTCEPSGLKFSSMSLGQEAGSDKTFKASG